jgi:hypothetical protein
MARTKELTLQLREWDEPGQVGYVAHTVVNGKYAHLDLEIVVRVGAGTSYDYWKPLVHLTAQSHNLDSSPSYIEEYKTTHTLPNMRSYSDTYSKWYALKIDRWGEDDVERQLRYAGLFAPVWKKIQKVVDDKRLTYQYKDGVSHILAALQIIGAVPMRHSDGNWDVYEYDSALSTID